MAGRPTVRASVRVPAKINLFLAVEGRRDDGYHDLTTVFQTVGVHDRVTASMADDPARHHPAHRRRLRIRLVHDGGVDVPDGDDNLVLRAAHHMLRCMGVSDVERREDIVDPLDVLIELEKDIPIAAGMAGGSADAAATVLALKHLWQVECTSDEIVGMTAELGADVPFCVTGGTALGRGTGTAVAQVMNRGEHAWVVGVSRPGLSTPDVFAAWDDLGLAPSTGVEAVLAALRTGDVDELAAAVHNDLQVAAFHLRPGLEERAAVLRDAGALAALVSGSGPTLLGLARSEEDAVAIAAAVEDDFDRVLVATSPAGGPKLDRGGPDRAG